MPLALFGITDGSLNLAVNLVILVLVVLWLALAYWTFADARRRIGDPILVTTASVLGLVPFMGPLIYTVLRPPEFLDDVREREIETQASELRMRHLISQSCPRCEHPIERSWLRCPECQHRLKDPCVSCNRPVDPRWSICPYCETQLRRPSGEREEGRRGSRRAEPDSEEPSRGADAKRSRASSRRRTTGPAGPPASSDNSPASSDDSTGTRSERKPRSKPAGPSGKNEQQDGDSRPRRRSTTKS